MRRWSLRDKASRHPLMIALAIIGLALPPLPTSGPSPRGERLTARLSLHLRHAASRLAAVQQRFARLALLHHGQDALPAPDSGADLASEEEEAPLTENEEAERDESPLDSAGLAEMLARLEGVAGRRPSERAARSLLAEGLHRPDASPHTINAGRLQLQSRRALDASRRDLPALFCRFTC